MDAKEEILEVKHGGLFKLRPPWTVTAVRESSRMHEGVKTPFLCRIKHRWRVIGDVYLTQGDSENDLLRDVLTLLATSDVSALSRCKRCGKIARKPSF